MADENKEEEDFEIGEDLEIIKTTRRNAGSGTWVIGSLNNHKFEALVFPEAASHREWEVNGDSRISKLCIRRLSDQKIVFNWDRGPDVSADPTVQKIVDFLCAGLADSIFTQ